MHTDTRAKLGRIAALMFKVVGPAIFTTPKNWCGVPRLSDCQGLAKDHGDYSWLSMVPALVPTVRARVFQNIHGIHWTMKSCSTLCEMRLHPSNQYYIDAFQSQLEHSRGRLICASWAHRLGWAHTMVSSSSWSAQMSRCSRVKLTFVIGDDYMFAYVQMKTVQKVGADRFKKEHLLCYSRRNGRYVVS